MTGLESLAPASRQRIVLATAAAATLLSIVAPRIGPLVAVSLTALAAVLVLAEGARRQDVRPGLKDLLVRPETPFLAWALVASLWSAAPLQGLAKALLLTALVLHAIILARHIHRIDDADIAAAARGFLIGFLIGGLYVCVEIATHDIVTRSFLTYFPDLQRGTPRHETIQDGVVIRLSGAHITRASAVFCFFFTPALLAATLHTRGVVRWLCYGCLAAFLLVVFFHSATHSQTAQLIAIVVTVSFALALMAPTAARWLAAALFAGLLALVVPASIAMFDAGLHMNKDIFTSGRARVIIWNYTAERVLERPLFGVGTHATRSLHEAREEQGIEKPDGFIATPATRAHPHNVYLQIWYELGAVGALAFAVLGLSLLRNISLLPRRSRPFAITHFAVCMTIIAPTYGLWQNWFQSVLVLSILALVLVAGGRASAHGLPQAAAWRPSARLRTTRS